MPILSDLDRLMLNRTGREVEPHPREALLRAEVWERSNDSSRRGAMNPFRGHPLRFLPLALPAASPPGRLPSPVGPEPARGTKSWEGNPDTLSSRPPPEEGGRIQREHAADRPVPSVFPLPVPLSRGNRTVCPPTLPLRGGLSPTGPGRRRRWRVRGVIQGERKRWSRVWWHRAREGEGVEGSRCGHPLLSQFPLPLPAADPPGRLQARETPNRHGLRKAGKETRTPLPTALHWRRVRGYKEISEEPRLFPFPGPVARGNRTVCPPALALRRACPQDWGGEGGGGSWGIQGERRRWSRVWCRRAREGREKGPTAAACCGHPLLSQSPLPLPAADPPGRLQTG